MQLVVTIAITMRNNNDATLAEDVETRNIEIEYKGLDQRWGGIAGRSETVELEFDRHEWNKEEMKKLMPFNTQKMSAQIDVKCDTCPATGWSRDEQGSLWTCKK